MLKQKLGSARKQLDSTTLDLAKIAIRQRSPAYADNKLISNCGQVADKIPISDSEKRQIEADVNMHMLTDQLKQRKKWKKNYKLNDR